MRIRTPSCRAASTKPAAAIVFPEAVGWRKRNRRIAPGSASGELGLEQLVVFDEPGVVVVVGLVVELDLRDRSVRRAVPVSVLVGGSLRRRDELGEHARERVDLVAAKLGAGRGARRILGEHALEPEHEPVAHLPARRRRLQARLDLGERVVQRRTTRGPRREGLERVLVRRQERLAEPGLGSTGRSGQVLGCVRRQRRDGRSLVHSGSTCCRAAPSEVLSLA